MRDAQTNNSLSPVAPFNVFLFFFGLFGFVLYCCSAKKLVSFQNIKNHLNPSRTWWFILYCYSRTVAFFKENKDVKVIKLKQLLNNVQNQAHQTVEWGTTCIKKQLVFCLDGRAESFHLRKHTASIPRKKECQHWSPFYSFFFKLMTKLNNPEN